MKMIKTIVTVSFIMICVCLFGSIKVSAAEPSPEFETVVDTGSNADIPLDDNIVDMDTVVDFTASEYGLQLYFADGTGYFLER